MSKKKTLVLIALLVIIASIITFNELNAWFFPTETQMKGDFAQEAMFFEKLADNKVQCGICFRRCIIPLNHRGFCQVRENREGILYNLVYNNPAALQIDPIEKEPLFHFLPGSTILCVGTAGCNFRCQHCHNWHLSQSAPEDIRFTYERTPVDLINEALNRNIKTISFTYNEPTILYEYLLAVAKTAQEHDLNFVFHTNATMNAEPLAKLLPYVDGITVDLKAFNDDFYQKISQGNLAHVLETLKIIATHQVHLEIVNLIIPTLNDDPTEIKAMCQWIYDNLGPQTPLHFTRFFPAYRLTNLQPTPVATLEQAYQIASSVGMQYVYVGNMPGHTYNSTYCPLCGDVLINRYHFTVIDNKIEAEHCANCNQQIPGVFQ